MNILKVHECVKVENQRLALENRFHKAGTDQHKKDIVIEIIKLTSEIKKKHEDIERDIK